MRRAPPGAAAARLPDALTTRGRACAAAGAVLVLAGVGLGFTDITRVGVLLLCLPAFGLLMVRRRPTGIRVERTTDPVRVTAGEAATVTLTLTNPTGSATALMLAEERLPAPLGSRPRYLLGSVPGGERRLVRYAVLPQSRGRFLLGPLSVALRDPFGMTQRFTDLGGPTELVVLPAVHRLPPALPAASGVGTEGDVPHTVALHGEDDQSIREYRDGDDLRRIHWPATARTGELMVRQEDRPSRRRAVVLLDFRADAHRGHGVAASFEWAVTAVASVGVHLAGLRYAVHLVSAETLRAARADLPREPDALLDDLCAASTGPASSFADAIRAAGSLSGAGGLVVAIVTAHDESALRGVCGLRQPGGTALALLLDASSFEGAGRGPTRSAEAARHLLEGAGWTTVLVTAGTDVAEAWRSLTRPVHGRHPGRVPA